MRSDADVWVEVRFLTTAEGGRATAVRVGDKYRPELLIDGARWACLTIGDGEIVEPGGTVQMGLKFLSPTQLASRLGVGTRFALTEGPRTVATGRVLQILGLKD